jgi:hypothetical protein
MNRPITFSGQPITAISDEDMLQLLLRDDLPRFLNELYADEADRRMGKVPPASICTEEVA